MRSKIHARGNVYETDLNMAYTAAIDEFRTEHPEPDVQEINLERNGETASGTTHWVYKITAHP